MSSVGDLDAKRKEKDRCVWCGKDGGHPTPLACNRIVHIDYDPDTGAVVGIDLDRLTDGTG